MNRNPYPTDVSDDEWAFVAPYLTLMSEAAPQREHSLREVFNGLRYVAPASVGGRAQFCLSDPLSSAGTRR